MTSLLSNSELPAHVLIGLVADLLVKRKWLLASAESCTGGLIASACTDLAGSSVWFDRGFVSYSNASKTDMLGVDAALIERLGAVSEEVARAMAQGALRHASAQISVAVTGIAGPSGGSSAKPVGTVWFGWATLTSTTTQMMRFDGDRSQVRAATVRHALQGLIQHIESTQ